jgi:enoyl-CoA hydratase/carnithine racemase
MGYELLELKEQSGGVVIMELKQFVFDTQLVREISAALLELEAQSGNMALITTSTHRKIYNAGIDFKMFDQNYQGAYGFVCEFSMLLGKQIFPSHFKE